MLKFFTTRNGKIAVLLTTTVLGLGLMTAGCSDNKSDSSAIDKNKAGIRVRVGVSNTVSKTDTPKSAVMYDIYVLDEDGLALADADGIPYGAAYTKEGAGSYGAWSELNDVRSMRFTVPSEIIPKVKGIAVEVYDKILEGDDDADPMGFVFDTNTALVAGNYYTLDNVSDSGPAYMTLDKFLDHTYFDVTTNPTLDNDRNVTIGIGNRITTNGYFGYEINGKHFGYSVEAGTYDLGKSSSYLDIDNEKGIITGIAATSGVQVTPSYPLFKSASVEDLPFTVQVEDNK